MESTYRNTIQFFTSPSPLSQTIYINTCICNWVVAESLRPFYFYRLDIFENFSAFQLEYPWAPIPIAIQTCTIFIRTCIKMVCTMYCTSPYMYYLYQNLHQNGLYKVHQWYFSLNLHQNGLYMVHQWLSFSEHAS